MVVKTVVKKSAEALSWYNLMTIVSWSSMMNVLGKPEMDRSFVVSRAILTMV